jgi:hypothetical protein
VFSVPRACPTVTIGELAKVTTAAPVEFSDVVKV